MRPWHALPLLGLSLLSSGCALIEDGAHNFCLSVAKPLETHRELARNRQWAESAWQSVGGANAGSHRSDDYAQGFKDGFAEYLYRGGDGEPPLVAPLHYRKVEYQTADGYTAIQDWFAGYRHGATYARDSGARRFVVGPSALPGEINDARPIDEPMPAPLMEEPVPLPTPRVKEPGPMPAPRVKEPAPPPRVQPPPEDMSALPRKLGSRPPPLAPMVSAIMRVPEPATFSELRPMPAPATFKGVSGPDLKSGLPSPEPLRIKINRVIQPPPEPEMARPRITSISVAPPPIEPEPPRARITTISITPPKE